ncbi:MAG TPA: outer membrane beta-barrel protein [Thermoanaerobaculia bacterium]|jgi:hypothetical protein
MNGRPLLLSLLLLLAIPAAAQIPNNEIAVSVGLAELGDFGDAPSIGVSYNHFRGERTSFRFGAFTASGERNDDDAGDTDVRVIYGTAEIHFRPRRFVSPYAGVGGAMTTSQIEVVANEFSADEITFAPIVSFGVDFNTSPRFVVGLDANWVYLRADLGARFPYVIDPLTLSASAKYRF